MRPMRRPCSSATGRLRRCVLLEPLHHLGERRRGGDRGGLGAAGNGHRQGRRRPEEAHQRSHPDQPALLGHHGHLVELLRELLVEPAERLEHVARAPGFARPEELGGHEAARRVLGKGEQLPDVLGFLFLHRLEHRLRPLLGEVAQDVGRLVGRHLLEEVRGLLGVDLLHHRGLDLGLGLGEGVGRGLGVERGDDRPALHPPQVLDDVGEIGRVHAGQLLVHLQPDGGGAGVHEPHVVPGDVVLREARGQAAHEPQRDEAGQQPAHRSREADLDPAQVEPAGLGLEHDVVHAHDLPAVDVDDLAVEDVAPQAESLAFDSVPLERLRDGALDQDDASLLGREARHLAPGQHRPRRPAPHEETLDRPLRGVDHEVVHAPEPFALGVDDREIEHFRDVDHERRVRRPVYVSSPGPAAAPRAGRRSGPSRGAAPGRGGRSRPRAGPALPRRT